MLGTVATSNLEAAVADVLVYTTPVQYALVRGNEERFFRLDTTPSFARLVLIKALEYETGTRFFNISVSACTSAKSGIPAYPLCSVVALEITIANVNVFPVVFAGVTLGPNTVSKGGRFLILEDLPAGSPVFQLSFTDQDVGEFGMITYSLRSPKTKFDLLENNATVVVNSLGSAGSHSVFVLASDGFPSTSFSYITTVIALDRPTFDSASYTATIAENSAAGTPVVRVSASVMQEANRSMFLYSIEDGNLMNTFSIDPQTGQISLSLGASLDHESQPNTFTLTVKCVETWSSLPRDRTATVSIAVTNVNDNAPTLPMGTDYSISVPEDDGEAATHTQRSLFTLEYADVDGSDGIISSIASLLSMNRAGQWTTDLSLFELVPASSGPNAVTLQTRTNATLDAEQFVFHMLTLNIFDGMFSASANLNVTVEDLDDNAPVFPSTFYSTSLPESIAPSTIVFHVMVTDRDDSNMLFGSPDVMLSTTATMPYEPVTAFAFDNVAKTLITTTQLDASQSPYFFYMIASDTTHTVIASVNISVSPDAPYFVNSPLPNVTVDETAAVGSIVAVVEGASHHIANPTITYALPGDGNGNFVIDSDSGTIRLAATLDAETQNIYELVVQITQFNGHSLSTTLWVTVTDLFDVPPSFTAASYFAVVQENTENAALVQAMATVQDSGVITYSIDQSSSPAASLFQISSTGLISCQALDIESLGMENVTFSVIAHFEGLQSTVSVTVMIVDQNDLTPTFNNDQTTFFTVPEDVVVGTQITQVAAMDGDFSAPNNEIVFQLEPLSTFFEINAVTGAISVKSNLFNQIPVDENNLTLTVIARDNGVPSRSATLVFTMQIIDRKPPQFTSETSSVALPEGVRDIPFYTAMVLKRENFPLTFTFEIVSVHPEPHVFTINAESGVVSTATNGPLVSFSRSETYSMTIRATDNRGLSSELVVQVPLISRSSFTPVFERPTYTVTIPENSLRNSKVVDVRAFVRNLTNLISPTISGYSLEASTDAFNIFAINNVTGEVTLRRNLYGVTMFNTTSFTVSALNAFYTPFVLSGSARVVVNVVGVNLFAPIYQPGVYVPATLQKNAPLGTSVLLIRALDQDRRAPFNTVSYSILGDRLGFFSISSDGRVTVARSPLNRMTTGGIAITIRASDGGSPSLFVERSFLVPVIETNDAPPVFSSSRFVVTIPSQTPVNTTIFTAFAPDVDDAADTTTYSLAASNVFGIESFTGRVFAKAEVPARTVTTLALTATDGIPILSSFSSLVIRVLPNTLEFASSTYSASITPDVFADTVLANTSVLDMPDSTAYPALAFAIESVLATSSLTSDPSVTLSSAPFTIDQSGVVKVTNPQSLSTLSADMFWINIIATNDSLTARATVMVNVSHPSVRLPKFAELTSAVSFPEAEPAGSQQIVLSWTYASVTNVVFELLAGSADFNVTYLSSSVVFTTTKALMYDFDGQKSYFLSVKVSDALFPSLSSTTQVEVTVLDVNNQAPVFTEDVYTIPSVFEQVLPLNPLALFAATDADAPSSPNSAVTFALSGSFASHFSLDAVTGVLSLVTPLLYSVTPTYELVVTASDAGMPQQHTSITIRGSVTQIVVSAPMFATMGVNFSLDDYKPAHVLFTALATSEPDVLPLDQTAPIQYALEGANTAMFSIDSSTGEVSVLAEANFDVTPMYTFTVIATKTTPYVEGVKSARLSVVVSVVNTFDPKPYFLESNFSFVILESSPAGVTVGSVIGFRDEEMGNPNTLMYSISDNNFFAIDGASGWITAKTVLPSNQQEKVSTVVTITDGKGYTASVPVTITIVDQNNNAPIFQNTINGSYTVEILQNTSAGTAVVQAFAVDADGGLFGTIVSYEILSGAANAFQIDTQTGIITVSGILTMTPFVMVVQATDGGQEDGVLGVDQVQRTSVTVAINVVPVDLFNPIFEQTVYNATIDEKPAAGLFVAQVKAMDADYLEPPIAYFIVDSAFSAALSIDAQTGIIVTTADAAALLNADVNGVSFSFAIKATAAGPLDVGFTQLSVMLNPLNDNAPMFVDPSPDALQIAETMMPGVLGTYLGVDADFGLDGVVTHTLVGADSSLFALDAETGVLTLLQTIAYAPMGHMFSFSVEIADGGSPARTASKSLTLEVLPVNRFVPTVTEITKNRLFEGSYLAGANVATVMASDEDSLRQIPAGAAVSYALIGDNTMFTIDATTGSIMVAQDSAFMPSTVVLNVRISDNGVPPRFVDVDVTLTFQRYPDPPAFSDAEYSVAVNELAVVNTVFLKLESIMPDADFVLGYELNMAGTYDSFAIDTATGELRVAKPLNRSLKASYIFSVSAAYVANPTRKVQASVKVTVDPATLLEMSLLMDQLLALYNVSREDLLSGRAVLTPPTPPPTTTPTTTEPPTTTTTTTTTTTPYPYADVVTYAGDKCAFPFVYNDNTYTTCTLTDFNNFWCSTSASYDSSGDDNSGFGICKLFGESLKALCVCVCVCVCVWFVGSCACEHLSIALRSVSSGCVSLSVCLFLAPNILQLTMSLCKTRPTPRALALP
jgi:hypothetical protein